MTDTRTKGFTPITSQDQLDEVIRARLARENERREKEDGTAELRAQLQAKDREIADLKKSHYQEATERAFAAELDNRGVTDQGRRERILRHVDLEAVEATDEGRPSREHVLRQLDDVSRDLPELLQPRGAGSRGSKKPVLETEKPLTRAEVEKMPPEEQNRPGMRERIDRFLAGERG